MDEKKVEYLYIVLPTFDKLESKTYGRGPRKIIIDKEKGTLTVRLFGENLNTQDLNEPNYSLAAIMLNVYSRKILQELEKPFVIEGTKQYEKAENSAKILCGEYDDIPLKPTEKTLN